MRVNGNQREDLVEYRTWVYQHHCEESITKFRVSRFNAPHSGREPSFPL